MGLYLSVSCSYTESTSFVQTMACGAGLERFVSDLMKYWYDDIRIYKLNNMGTFPIPCTVAIKINSTIEIKMCAQSNLCICCML